MFDKKVKVDDIHIFFNPNDSGTIFATVGGDEAIETSGYDLTFHLIKMAAAQSSIGNIDEAKKCLASWGDFAEHMSKMICVAHKRIEDKEFLTTVSESKEVSRDVLAKMFFNEQN